MSHLYWHRGNAQKFIESKKPGWIKDHDYDRLYSIAQKTLELDSEIKKNASILDIMKSLKSLMNSKPLSKKKPDLISDEDWEIFIQMDNEFRLRKGKNEELELRLKKEEAEIQSIKTKVEKQLKIIHAFLNDHSVVDRIEDYSNVFAPGNFENLKNLAKLMAELRKGQR